MPICPPVLALRKAELGFSPHTSNWGQAAPTHALTTLQTGYTNGKFVEQRCPHMLGLSPGPALVVCALERGVRSEHVAGCYCSLDSVVVGGFLQGRVAAVSLEVMRDRVAFNQSELMIEGKK